MTVLEQRTMESIQDFNSKIPDLTLRDLFAMSAITSLIAIEKDKCTFYKSLANKAYGITDAMLEVRKEKIGEKNYGTDTYR